jgi:hypothetical protein
MQLTLSIRFRSIDSPPWILQLKKTPKNSARQESAKSDAGRVASRFKDGCGLHAGSPAFDYWAVSIGAVAVFGFVFLKI